MKWFASLLGILYFVKKGSSSIVQEIINPYEDPVSRQLFDYKEKHPHPGKLTTSAGQPIDCSEAESLQGDLLLHPFAIDSIQNAVNERIPDRVIFSKGIGAFGSFVVTNNATSKYTKIKMFEKFGKKTDVLVRFSVSSIEKGGSDLFLSSIRGFSVKFYTEEGNFDLVGCNIPVHFYRDPILFSSINRAFKPHPKTNVRDFTTAIDFIINNPVTLHAMLWAYSEYGLPRGYTHMNGYPLHTFELYNCEGHSYFVRFRILTTKEYKSFSVAESAAISSFDPDFFIRDLYNLIETGDYPKWKMDMLVLKADDPQKCDFDPFDVTNLWPKGSYDVVEIGELTLDRNVDNSFAQVELAAFNPGNLVPGILAHDQLMKGRMMAYPDAHINRMGVNRNNVDVNCPKYSATYNRDGKPPVRDNMKDAPNYFPNTFNGPKPFEDKGRPKRFLNLHEVNDESLKNCKVFFNEKLKTDASKQRLVDNIARACMRCDPKYQEKFANLLCQADEKLGELFRKTLAYLEKHVKLPNVVEEIDRTDPNPFSAVDYCS